MSDRADNEMSKLDRKRGGGRRIMGRERMGGIVKRRWRKWRRIKSRLNEGGCWAFSLSRECSAIG
jgi:hypothetical protein